MTRTGEKDPAPFQGGPLEVAEISARPFARVRRPEARPGDGAATKWYSHRLPKAAE